MILSCNNIEKSFDDKLIIKNCSFVIEDREKAAIVGINGAGKSTLLKIIIKELYADKGDVFLQKNKTLGYLSQYQNISVNNTIYDEMLEAKKDIIDMESNLRNLELKMKDLEGSALDAALSSYNILNTTFELNNGYSYKSEIAGVLKGLGFTENDFQKNISALSGGQKTRVALGKMLLSKPDIILLDEPTNHLDINSIAWLETYLLNYPGAVIIVSHDRYFLDKIVSKIIEIDMTNVRTFSGNYSSYKVKKAQLKEIELKAYQNQQKEIKHQEDVIEKLRSFNREKSIKRAESREKLLNKIDVIDKPIEFNSKMNLELVPDILSGNDVLTVSDLKKSFDGKELFSDLNFEIKRGEKIAITGLNGTGKTTILKIINNIIPADFGKVKTGSNVHIGYYDQEHQILNMNKSIFDEISDSYPNLTGTRIRNILAAFLFTNDDVFKLIRDLSGGERGRVSLAKLMLSEANFLILDEPTNHLDISSKEILEEAINNYTGTVLYVSHDRYFINSTATRILDLENKKLISYAGNYDYYLEKHELLSSINNQDLDEMDTSTTEKDNKADWQEMKNKQALERKKQNEFKKTEDEISKLEEESSLLFEELNKEEIFSSPFKCLEIQKKQD